MRLGSTGLMLRGGSFIGDAGLGGSRMMGIAWMKAQALRGVLTRMKSREKGMDKPTLFGQTIWRHYEF